MKLSFDKPATRKLELWATHNGLEIDDLEGISGLVMQVVDGDLAALRPVQFAKPQVAEKGVGA